MMRVHKPSLRAIILVLTLTVTLIVFSLKNAKFKSLWSRDVSQKFSGFDNSLGSSSMIVPNIVHFIKAGEGHFSLTDLICIRAAWLNQRPDSILIHCNSCENIKGGPYWSEVQKVPGLRLTHAKLPTHIFGRRLSSVFHSTDVLRLQILSTLGGIFLDLDVFVVKSLDHYRHFEISIGVPPKQYLGTQVLIAHRQARFLKLWLESYRFYRADKWYYNAGELPTTAILMKNPSLVHVVPWDFGVHMLVAQIFGVCSAHWRDFHAIHLLSRHRKYLVNDTSAPVEFSPENIKTYNKSFGEMARYVLFGETGVISDRRRIATLESIANVNLTALPRWCDEGNRKEDWKIAKPMPNFD